MVIAIIAILAAILLPSLNKAMEQGRKISCVNNLKSLSSAFAMYFSDNNDFIVPNYGAEHSWSVYVISYLASAKKFNGSAAAGNEYRIPTGVNSATGIYSSGVQKKNPTGVFFCPKVSIFTSSLSDNIHVSVSLPDGFASPVRSRLTASPPACPGRPI